MLDKGNIECPLSAENTITGTKLRPFDRPFHGGQMLAKREVLQNDIKSLFESEKNVKEPVQRQLYHGWSVGRFMLKSQ